MATALLLLLACRGASLDSGGAGDDAARVAVGTGNVAREVLSEGAQVTMVHGPQGGWHMLGSVRTWGMDPLIDIHFTIRALEQDDALISDGLYHVKSVPDALDGSAFCFPGMYGFLAVESLAQAPLDTPPELLSWQRVAMRMDVTDALGRAAWDEVEVIAAPDADDLDLVPGLLP